MARRSPSKGHRAIKARLQLLMTLSLWSACLGLMAVGQQSESDIMWSANPELAVAPTYAIIGAYLIARVPGNSIGPLFMRIALAAAILVFASEYYMIRPSWAPQGLPGRQYVGWVGSWVFIFPFFWTVTLLPLTFPDGRPPSPRWRPLLWVSTWLPVLIAGCIALLPGPTELMTDTSNPFGIDALAPLHTLGEPIFAGPFAACVAGGLAAPLLRLWRGGPEERRQIAWFATASLATTAMVFWPFGDITTLRWIVTMIAVTLIPLACALAILRYRLYAIDVVLRWTLIHAITAIVVSGVFIAATTALAFHAGQGRPSWMQLAALLLAASVFHPIRTRVQHLADRLIYRDRADPYRVVTLMGARITTATSPQQALTFAAETIAGCLPIAAVAIEPEADAPTVSIGQHSGDPLRLPLIWQGQRTGTLAAWPRATASGFDRLDRQILTELAQHIAPIVSATRLTGDLQRAHQHTIEAREEERRRLRRDLHDGLGPTLAGIALGAEAARTRITATSPPTADLLSRLRDEAEAATAEVRRLVYGLRPPSLDELGLPEAIRRHALGTGELTIAVEANHLPDLPAAVEAAAYRIATEALNNVARHAHARSATVSIGVTTAPDGSTLDIRVEDDGRGLPPDHLAGVGLTSMRERATELGGTCQIERRPIRGTRVHAHLPLGAADGPPAHPDRR